MLRIRQFIVMAWMLSATAAFAHEQSADATLPEEVPEPTAEYADVAADRQPGENGMVERCAAMAMAERLAPILRQLVDDAERNQAEAYRDVSSLEEVLAQLEKGLGTLPARSDCAVAALLSSGEPLALRDAIADDALLLEELAQHRDSLHPIGIPFPEQTLTCLYYENAIVDHIVHDANGDPRILLTSVTTNDAHYKRFPNIVHMADAGYWVRTPIPRTADGWTHVHLSRDLQHIVLAMDNIPESPGWETRFVVSTDRGRSWRYGQSIRKYVYFDIIDYFSMSEAGSGTAVEHYAGDVGGYEERGYYIFETNDWGLTWSDRAYEKEFDTSGYVDVSLGRQQRASAEMPLSRISLLGFDQCQAL